MSVQELSRLHRRYIALSDRFKAAWTFHQFLQGLQKVFADEDLRQERISFQELYNTLKSLSQHLNTAATSELSDRLERAEEELAQRLDVLLKEDNRVSPSLLRQFFQRVKNYDEKILTQLLRFYAFTYNDSWENDRIDKVDFLITKLGEEIQDLKVAAIMRDPTRVKEIFQSLWANLGKDPVAREQIEELKRTIQDVRNEIAAIENLDDLNEKGCVLRYRSLKHELGGLIFEPEITPVILETNLFFRHAIQDLYEQEERRITTEYLEVFELERDATPDTELDEDLKQFRSEIELFERHLQDKNVRLEELAYIRNRVRYLIPRLRKAAVPVLPAVEAVEAEAAVAAAAAVEMLGESESDPSSVEGPRLQLYTRGLDEEHLKPYIEILDRTLEGTDPQAAPKAVSVSPQVRPLRLRTRDVMAYRRIRGDEECDRELEEFILRAAALRIRINEEAEEIAASRDLRPRGEVDEVLLAKSRITTRIADSFEKSFSHFITQSLQDGELTEAQKLQVLRMRLLRDYTGLWLVAQGVD